MVFAGSAARGSAIGTATEGMVSYLTDNNRIEVFTTYWEQVYPVSTFGGTINGNQVAFGGTTTTTSMTATSALDNGTIFVNGTSAVTITVPDVLNTWDTLTIWRNAGGTVTIAAGTGVTDFDQVRADINTLAKKYNIRQVGIDRWNATQLANQLQGDGVNVLGYGQGYGAMSGPAKVLESLVVSEKLLHGGHPVLAWQAGNVAIQQDHNGNIKPSKAKSNERIDGIVALVMALGVHASQEVKGPAIEPSILIL